MIEINETSDAKHHQEVRKVWENYANQNETIKPCNDNTQGSDEVYQWLRDHVGLSQYYDMFIDNGIDDMEIIADTTMEDLNNLGYLKLGHRKKIIKYDKVQRLLQ